MNPKLRFRLRLWFFVLAALAIAQLGWWSYLLVDQQGTITALLKTPEAIAKQDRFLVMILAEGGFWLIMWGLGLIAIYRAVMKERWLYQAHRDFLSAITHELKTPIANIQLGLEALQKDLSPAQKQTFIHRCLVATDRLHQQINHVLSLNQQSIVSEKHHSEIVVSELIQEILRECDSTYDKLRIEWHSDIPVDQTVFTQREALKLVLKALIDNSVKYGSIPEHAPSPLKIHILWIDRGLEIHDNGIGFEENPESLFVDFFRGQIAKELAVPGTGVGLSVAKQIATKMHWRLELASPGRGLGCVARLRFLK